MSSEPADPSLPARLRELHKELPLAGGRPNAVLSLPDDRILYLAAVLRDTPQQPPALSPEAWREFLALLRPHAVHALLAYRLSAWPEDCRPPAEVMDFLKRQHLLAAARRIRTGHGSGAMVQHDGRLPWDVDRAPSLRTLRGWYRPALF